MAKLLQLAFEQISRFWEFIGNWLVMFWTHLHRGTLHKHDIMGLLQRLKEEVHGIQRISNGTKTLNKGQCTHLRDKVNAVVELVCKMIASSSDVQEFVVALEELCWITWKLGVLVKECGNQNWCEAIAFQINNREAFRELMSDLTCCWDVICDIHSASHSRGLTIDLNMPTLQTVEDDEKYLDKVLEEWNINDSNYEWREYLMQRLRYLQLEGGELDGVEVPCLIDSLKPKLVREIGQGAYGAVYESIWLGLKCATKILLAPEGISNFLKEVGILVGLSHPNLIKIIYCGVGESIGDSCSSTREGENDKNVEKLYLVMELMDFSLSGMLKKQRKPLPYLLAIDIMYQIASGMCYLHDMHVAHLDLKPDNVLMRPSCVEGGESHSRRLLVKLADYGVSKIDVQSKVLGKQKLDCIGTSKYMAPEIIQGESHANYFKADVWSFAMTCSEILSRVAPFGKESNRKKILARVKEFERPILPTNCEGLTRLIEECWMKDALKRPSFFEICERLIELKKKFLRETSSTILCPKFEIFGAWLQKKSRTNKAKGTHAMKVNEATMHVNNLVTIGLASKLTKVKDRLKQVRIVGLVGTGGIGKTTLANATFDELKFTYDASCFAKDLKNRHDSLEVLCDMLRDFGQDPKRLPTNLVDAQNILKKILGGKKVLIILDDIKDQNQLDDLLHPDILNDNAGISLIITTRDWDVIKYRVRENGKIQVVALDENASKELFILHSCGSRGSLPVEFSDIGERIVKACNGLPLSLEVMGAYLRGEARLRSWERALRRIQRGRCLDGNNDECENTKLWSTLRISFDGLKTVEKNMFLDIACFFCKDMWPNGMPLGRALPVWTINDTPPLKSFNVLIERSLVNLDRRRNIKMHDQLRDMGRMIVEREEEYLGSRVWNMNLIPSTQITSKGAKKVEVILFNKLPHDFQGQNCSLGLDLSNLRLLIIRDQIGLVSTNCQVPILQAEEGLHKLKSIFMTCEFESLPKRLWEVNSLKTMDIEGCKELITLPDEVENMTLLTHLNLRQCTKLTTLPKTLGNLNSLTHLTLMGCSNLRMLPDGLGNLTSLEELDLEGCSRLTRLRDGLANLTSLKKLSISRCSRLTTLPEALGNLTSLTKLDIHECSSLTTLSEGLGNLTSLTKLDISRCSSLTTLPEGIGNLISLTKLDISRCSRLTTLPEGLGNLNSLTKLDMSWCSSLTTLPEGIGNLIFLTKLHISWCPSLRTLPEGVGNLTSLRELDIHGCSSLTTLPEGFGNLTSLTKLDISRCSSLTTLPEGLGNLTSLTELHIWECSSLTTLTEGLGNLTCLTELHIPGCSSLTTLPEELGNLTSLTKLDIQECSSLTTIPEGIGNLIFLTKLHISWCPSLRTLPEGVGNLTSLKKLDISRCSRLRTLPQGLGNLTSLTELDIEGCSSLKTFPEGLGNLIFLKNVHISWCPSLTTLPEGLGNVTSLTELYIHGCSRLTTLPKALGNLRSLTKLDIEGCSSLTTLREGLGNLTSLTTLHIDQCSRLTKLPEGLGNLSSLTRLDIHGCSSLTTLPEGLGNLSSLTKLDISRCSSLTTLPEGLGNLTSLTKLDISRCSSLTTLPEGLGNLISLTQLDIEGCSSLTTLPEELGNLTSLTKLDIQECSSLTTLPEGIGNLIFLTKLHISWCPSLRTLPEGVGNLTSLKKLDIEGCSSLTTLPEGLGNLISLKNVHISWCPSLTTLPEGLGNLISLTKLHISRCSRLRTLSQGFGNLTSLTELDIEGCSSLTTLSEGLGNLISLKNVHISWCLSLTTLPEGLGNLISLTKLDISRCSRLSTLPEGLGNLISLTKLDMSWCSSLTTLSEGLGNLTSLTKLDIHGCSSLTTLPEGLGNLTSLAELDIHGCSSLKTLLDGFGNLISLIELDIHGCSSLTTLPEGLGNLTSLTKLDISRCSSLTTLPEGLGNLTSLTELHIWECSSLTTLTEGLGNVTCLTKLDIEGCSSLTTLREGLGNLTF